MNFMFEEQRENKFLSGIKWSGDRPTQCNACEGDFKRATVFIDGRIRGLGWGIFHVKCFKAHGGTLGVGCGQKYDMKTLEKING